MAQPAASSARALIQSVLQHQYLQTHQFQDPPPPYGKEGRSPDMVFLERTGTFPATQLHIE
ncbi:hypothetical protein MYCTH_2123395 [Thermothelomyces thermophilus ATCC 42464]|uniref:Uncharacterized protein n=1 Tax=Thermothelomyces thermophilus (strain ATCC 42464 / BCRC 31852 / DSM 1799) TaxID=573729 RepID=G2Q4K8_THET4|nr:uncharacterized protein MYCTH_2123395 [Thermothelomyces thermophilus ATCC 42464]AEO54497.1 hypothetical protein MYCTH_2123395 [Thermothelomyces thermophilus ATCC 42464]